ncbi:PREDICTED: uncharacterized protein LOC109210044 [Nicotiana attenuata]|uniref:uncharacterized protein LOC109210044 n=1 Tax=Nicotiana attenuata TaxID=49451 RepID=UPI000905CCDC|nr:PREDICTED: uncharacterized protein LOC109210044 [Nicotiana attenuata]
MAITNDENNHSPANESPTTSATRFATIDHNHPLYLQPTDTPASSLISLQLTGSDNYAIWSRSMRIGLLGKSKFGFVDGRYPKFKFVPDLHDLWEKVNAMVLSWIMNAVRPGSLSTVFYALNAHKVWKDLKETFDKVNRSRVIHLHREIHTLIQGTMSVADYFSKLRDLWGLNDSYSQARSQMMIMSAVVQVAEVAEGNAMFSNRGLVTARGNPRPQKKIPQCDYCHCKGHTKETCYKLVGYTPDFKSKKKGVTSNNPEMAFGMQNQQNHQIPQQLVQHPTPYFTQEPPQSVIQKSVQQPAPFFAQEQYQQIVQLLDKGIDEGTSCKTAAAGTLITLVSQFVNNRWIIDIGASNHMTSTLQLLKSCQPVPEYERNKVHLPTGEVALVTHIGKSSVFTNQDISDVLYLPDFKYNMLSVSKLTKELHCLLAFFPDFCIFQDLYSDQGSSLQGSSLPTTAKSSDNVVNAVNKGGVIADSENNNSSASVSGSCSQWNMRLCHAPIEVIRKHEFLSKLKSCDESFCTVCPLAKQTKLLFQLSTTVSQAAFELIHCDVWGPYRVPTYDGKRFFVTIVDDFTRHSWICLIVSKADTIFVLRDF